MNCVSPVVTPIHKLDSFSRSCQIYIKRDDLLPFCFGGNKARIANSFLADLNDRGASCLVAYGSTRSNLCRVLSCACAAMGLRCVVVSPSEDEGSRPNTFNSLMVQRFGAEVVACEKDAVRETVSSVLNRLEGEGERPYYIYGDETGRGNEEVPVRAYRSVSHEIRKQEQELGFSFDRIYLAVGTGMTYAGLLVGDFDLSIRHRIVGISVARPAHRCREEVLRYASASVGSASESLQVEIVDSYLHGGYGRSDESQRKTMEHLMLQEGVCSDETYVGKAFDGMLRHLAEESAEGEKVLFIHTGGTPLYFDYLGAQGE